MLYVLAERCSFAVPRVVFAAADGEFDVRTVVPGSAAPWRFYAMVLESSQTAFQAGSTIGAMLAQQHSRIHERDVSSWLPHVPAWPKPREWIRERLPSVVGDRALIARADAVMDAYETVTVHDADRALVHTDVGFHNLAIDLDSHAINGIFDYEGSAWADRHHDFRYLVLDFDGYAMLDGATSAYEAVTGRTIRRDRVLLYDAACAVGFLAYRAGIPPEERWCGRTLAEDLRWSSLAIARAMGSS